MQPSDVKMPKLAEIFQFLKIVNQEHGYPK